MSGETVLVLPAFMEMMSRHASHGEFLKLWSLRAEMRPFILEPCETEVLLRSNDPEVLGTSMPFPVCYIEFRGEKSLAQVISATGSEQITIYSGAFIETENARLEAWLSTRFPDGNSGILNIKQDDVRWTRLNLSVVLEKVLLQIRSKKIGSEKCNFSFKARTKQGTEFFKIKKIIRVCGSEKTAIPLVTVGGIVDWSHRWEVMGHWRKIEGLGKNRAGEYVLSGLTWVNPHAKGPEHLPLVPKLRSVSA